MLYEFYKKEVVPKLMKELGKANPMNIPRLQRVVINSSLSEAVQNVKVLDTAMSELAQISGQKPVRTRAKKAIAAFKIREGMPIGCKVTLRRKRMYEFFNRLVHVALPRSRDFKGLPKRGFDGRGNYTLGLSEQIIFPEIAHEKVDKPRGMNISIVTTARSNREGELLLEFLGFPFVKREGTKKINEGK